MFNCTAVSDSLPVITVNPAHGLGLYVGSARGCRKGAVDLRHVDHGDHTIIVPATV